MKIVATHTLTARLHMPEFERVPIRDAINMAIVGQKEVNYVNDKGEIVAISFPEEKLKVLEEAHHTLCMGRSVDITFDITDSGEWINYRVEKPSSKTKIYVCASIPERRGRK